MTRHDIVLKYYAIKSIRGERHTHHYHDAIRGRPRKGHYLYASPCWTLLIISFISLIFYLLGESLYMSEPKIRVILRGFITPSNRVVTPSHYFALSWHNIWWHTMTSTLSQSITAFSIIDAKMNIARYICSKKNSTLRSIPNVTTLYILYDDNASHLFYNDYFIHHPKTY